VHQALDQSVVQAIGHVLSRRMANGARTHRIQTLNWLIRALTLERLRTGPRAAVDLDRLVDFLALGWRLTKEEAAMLLCELRPREVERLTADLVRPRGIDVAAVDDVLNEFHALTRAGGGYGSGGEDFAREPLSAAVGPDKAEDFPAFETTTKAS
jgi:hypothetical protein